MGRQSRSGRRDQIPGLIWTCRQQVHFNRRGEARGTGGPGFSPRHAYPQTWFSVDAEKVVQRSEGALHVLFLYDGLYVITCALGRDG